MGRHREPPRIFEADYYRRLYEIEASHPWSRGMRAAMVALLRRPLAGGPQGGLRILDVGCGTGLLLDFLRRYELRGEPLGIDLSIDALRFCRRRGAAHLVRAGATELPAAAAAFHLVLCIDTLQHLFPAGADLAALREMVRSLVPGGLLYLRTNSAFGHPRLQGVDPDLYRRYRLGEVEELVVAAGLVVERSTYLNALPSLWAAAREHLRPGRWRAPATGPGLAIRPFPRHLSWLGAILYGLLALEARLVGAGVDLPFGHSVAVVARRPGAAARQS